MTGSDDDIESDSEQKLGFILSPALRKRVKEHIYLARRLDNDSLNRQKFLFDAIKEKLDKDRDTEDIESLKEIRVAVRLDSDTANRLDERVDFIRKFTQSYSKKQLVVDAIIEKLERDGKKIRLLLEKAKVSTD